MGGRRGSPRQWGDDCKKEDYWLVSSEGLRFKAGENRPGGTIKSKKIFFLFKIYCMENIGEKHH